MTERTLAAKSSKVKKEVSASQTRKDISTTSINSPVEQILFLQRITGNQAVQKLIKSGTLQAKLGISQPNDIYEQEADKVAEHVMRIPEPIFQPNRCAKCDEGEKSVLQPKESPGQVPISQGQNVPPIVHEVLNSPGKPLDSETFNFMELRFGHNFSKVRVHTNAKAAESARAVNARAFTVGEDVVFGAEQYSPMASAGRKLLAHELVHTIQQRSGGNSRLVINDKLENEHKTSAAADNALFQASIPILKSLSSRSISIMKQKLDPDESLKNKHNLELEPNQVQMNAPAVRKVEKCEETPGGSTDCQIDKMTGIPTGEVTHSIVDTNPCTKPCVEQHEEIHIKQLKRLCPELRKCYLAVDKGKRPALDCVQMAIFGIKKRECQAYNVSVPCMENRLKNNKICQSKANKEYGTRKLNSEKCFRDKNCK